MMHINFLVIKGDCIKISAIKEEFFFENITLMLYVVVASCNYFLIGRIVFGFCYQGICIEK